VEAVRWTVVGTLSLFCGRCKEQEERRKQIISIFSISTEKDGGLWTFSTNEKKSEDSGYFPRTPLKNKKAKK